MALDADWIIGEAKAQGFDLCGVAPAEQFPEFAQFTEWLERGYAGQMAYLEDARRRQPSLAMPDARSVIVCALNYNTAHPYSTEAAAASVDEYQPARSWVSRYAWGDDYHELLGAKLNVLVRALKEKFPGPFAARAYADTGPIAERVFAKHAGLGWIGKNTLLLNEALGSWLFLGVILTSLDLTPSRGATELPPDLCGNCRQCLDACPTGALVEPYLLDARRCISYLTIELRGPITEELREAMGWQVYGCDICQDVCPYNRQAPTGSVRAFEPREFAGGLSLFQPTLEWLAELSEDEFLEAFRGSAMKRAKWAGLVRNACIALGNSHIRKGTAAFERVVKLLERLAVSENLAIAESAQWALLRIQSYG